jgi:Mlc titration factor MtfA (ptsG expression regulator)
MTIVNGRQLRRLPENHATDCAWRPNTEAGDRANSIRERQTLLGLTRWWRRRLLEQARARLDPEIWTDLWRDLPLLEGLDAGEAAALQDLTLLFLHGKAIEEAQGARLTQRMRLLLALQACLPILRLGLDWYAGWYAVIVYPDEFAPERAWIDDDGVAWTSREPLSGEAWEQGPVILSWADVEAGMGRDGYNVVIHELAHKLDLRDGAANGCPPLRRGMSHGTWAEDFGTAFHDLSRRLDAGEDTPLDPYAATSPAEFFAVCSEAFFELPHLLAGEYPGVYGQLREFYRQDPIRRLPPALPP